MSNSLFCDELVVAVAAADVLVQPLLLLLLVELSTRGLLMVS